MSGSDFEAIWSGLCSQRVLTQWASRRSRSVSSLAPATTASIANSRRISANCGILGSSYSTGNGGAGWLRSQTSGTGPYLALISASRDLNSGVFAEGVEIGVAAVFRIIRETRGDGLADRREGLAFCPAERVDAGFCIENPAPVLLVLRIDTLV